MVVLWCGLGSGFVCFLLRGVGVLRREWELGLHSGERSGVLGLLFLLSDCVVLLGRRRGVWNGEGEEGRCA